MGRNNDTFLSDAKNSCRLGNLKAVLESKELLDPTNPILRCDWCELMGESGVETLRMLESRKFLRPGGFVGIDTDELRIDRLQSERPDLKWVSGDLFTKVGVLCEFDIGVLNIDGYGQVGSEAIWSKLSTLTPLIQSGIRKFGTFVLFLNKDLDSVTRRKERPSIALRRHVDIVCKSFSSLPFPLSPDKILPSGVENMIDSPKFTGTVGGFEIYKSHSRAKRMANLRLSF